jgi:hypothetical protein
MRERHNWARERHPPACTCASCTQRRAVIPAVKKKNKPKSLRGKPKADPLGEAFAMFADFEKKAREVPEQGELGEQQGDAP